MNDRNFSYISFSGKINVLINIQLPSLTQGRDNTPSWWSSTFINYVCCMIDKKNSNSRHFGQPSDTIDDFSLFSTFLKDIVFDVVKLKTTHYKAVDWVDYKQTAFTVGFYLLQRLFDKVVSLTEIRGFFINKHLLMLLKLSFIHRTVCEWGESIPIKFLFSCQIACRNTSWNSLHKSKLTPSVLNMAMWVLPHPAYP